jgi:hypothetical protein
MTRKLLPFAAANLFWFALIPPCQVRAEIIPLYDDSQGNLPSDQDWLQFTTLGGSGSQTAVSSGVRLESDLSAGSGYSNHQLFSTPENPLLVNSSFPTLRRSRGFSLSFELQISSETHTSEDRAGFSVILLASDGRGIELGFWEDRIFAQSDQPLFEAAESTNFDTTAAEQAYELSILGESYSLEADGAELLSGSLRDYSAFDVVPYTLSDYLFLGDNTTSGAIDATLGEITLNSQLTAIPEPSFLPLLIGAAALSGLRRRSGRGAVVSDRWSVVSSASK